MDYDIELAAGSGRELTLSLRLRIAGAERDVGIMSDYVDDWEVIGFHTHFSKRAIKRFNAFLANHPELNEAIDKELNELDLAEYD